MVQTIHREKKTSIWRHGWRQAWRRRRDWRWVWRWAWRRRRDWRWTWRRCSDVFGDAISWHWRRRRHWRWAWRWAWRRRRHWRRGWRRGWRRRRDWRRLWRRFLALPLFLGLALCWRWRWRRVGDGLATDLATEWRRRRVWRRLATRLATGFWRRVGDVKRWRRVGAGAVIWPITAPAPCLITVGGPQSSCSFGALREEQCGRRRAASNAGKLAGVCKRRGIATKKSLDTVGHKGYNFVLLTKLAAISQDRMHL